MSQKVINVTPEEAKYIDPNQVVSIKLIDGTNITVRKSEQTPEDEFVEETKDEEKYKTEKAPEEKGQKLRGRLGEVLAGAAIGTAAALGTAAAIGGAALRRPYYGYGYGYGYPRPMFRPVYRPMYRPGPFFY